MNKKVDVAIIGSGFAGLTLALQLRKRLPAISILLIEKNHLSKARRDFKVGESMVEVSSWYLGQILELNQYLLQSHLPKFGLRFFLSESDNSQLGIRPEYGLMSIPEKPPTINSPIPGVHLTTFNVDRSLLEGYLQGLCNKSQVEILEGSKVRSINLGNEHELICDNHTTSKKISAKWVIDASGNQGIISRKHGKRREGSHKVNAVWFRLKGRFDPDELSTDEEFLARLFEGMRWRSTNHFMGKGYWIWLIPLPNEITSFGVMTDPDLHDMKDLNTRDRILGWLKCHEPKLAEKVSNTSFLDFKALKTRSYQSERSFSVNRWAISGDSAFHCDALYSPGGDFIAVANTLITRMVEADFQGNAKMLPLMVTFGNRLMNGMFNHYMGLYSNIYSLMGSPVAMLQKIAWDTAIYFAYNVLLFRNSRFCDPAFHRKIRFENEKLNHLKDRMVRYFNELNGNDETTGQKYIDQSKLELIQKLYQSSHEALDEKELIVQLGENLNTLEDIADRLPKLVA